MAKISKRRMAKFQEFIGWVQSDPAIKVMAVAVCRRREVDNIGVLAQKHPKIFDEVYDAALDLREQAPPEDRPGFLR